MKKYIYLLTILALFSCQNESLSLFESENEEFYCHIEDEAITRTAIDENNNITWSADDQIVIFKKSSVPTKYQVKESSVGKTSGGFNKISTDEFDSGFELDHNVAFYPYQENIEITKLDSISYKLTGYTFPSEQTYVEKSFANGSFPMASVSDDYYLTFRNICGGIKLRLTGKQIVTSISIEGKNSEIIAGDADVSVYSDEELNPYIAMSSNGLSTVTLNCGNGVQLHDKNPVDFIISLPPVTFSSGFEISVSCADGSTYTLQSNKVNSIVRSSLLVMPIRKLDGSSDFNGGENVPVIPGHNPEPCFSETVELMGLIFRLAGASEYCECQVYSVTNSADKYFASMKNHRAVQLAKEYRQTGVSYDAVTGYANQLIFDENGKLIFDPDYLEGSNGGFEARWNERQRNDMLIAVNDFYEESDFHNWFISTKAEQEQAIASFKSVCNLDYTWFDTFYGKNDKISSRIILSFIIGPNNNGISLKRKDGTFLLTPVLGALAQNAGIVGFYGDMNLVVHEFSHPYCNPLIDANWSPIKDKATEIYKRVASVMQSQAYSNANTMMCETLVRTCAIRYMMSHGQEDQVNSRLMEEEGNGFIMVRYLVKIFEKYETGQYSTLAEFMPEFIKAVNDFDPDDPENQGGVEEPDTLPKDYVDLGLVMKDGKKLYFATRNVGETFPGGIGSTIFRWGATLNGGPAWNQEVGNGIKLDAAHDIATLTWGEKWHIPSREEWNLLISKCDYERKEADESGYGVAGYFFYNKSDRSKFIFLPVAAWANELEYWTSESNFSGRAWTFNSENGKFNTDWTAGVTSTGFAIRPVFVE